MLNAGVEPHIAEKFIENDITGAILMTLKSEDLKELGIGSLGIRMKLWHHVSQLRGIQEKSSRPTTPIENEESREARKERRRVEKCDTESEAQPRTQQAAPEQTSTRRHHLTTRVGVYRGH